MLGTMEHCEAGPSLILIAVSQCLIPRLLLIHFLARKSFGSALLMRSLLGDGRSEKQNVRPGPISPDQHQSANETSGQFLLCSVDSRRLERPGDTVEWAGQVAAGAGHVLCESAESGE